MKPKQYKCKTIDGMAFIEMKAYVDSFKEVEQLQSEKQELVEVLDSFLKYYESDFFHVSAIEQRVYAEWVVKAKKLLEKHKQ